MELFTLSRSKSLTLRLFPSSPARLNKISRAKTSPTGRPILQERDPGKLVDLGLAELWSLGKKIGPYGLVKVDAESAVVRVIVNAKRFSPLVAQFLATSNSRKLNLKSAERIISHVLKSEKKRGKAVINGDVLLLEDLLFTKVKGIDPHVAECLLLQTLLEAHSGVDSRLVQTQSSNGLECRLLIKKGGAFQIYDSSKRISQDISDTQADQFEPMEIAAAQMQVEKEKKFSVFNSLGKEVSFQVSGRTPTERRFAREKAEIAAAKSEDLVPYEILFHPFWRRYGHTTLRIGESLYEFSSDGWRAHNTGLDSARAFVFNNPFFKSRFSVFSETGMPPISFGTTRYAPKEQVQKLSDLLDYKSAVTGRHRERFNLFFYNCNKALRGAFREVGISGFEGGGYLDFSSVLTFNYLLNEAGKDSAWIYPLPGVEVTADNVRNWVPGVIYLKNTVRRELARAAKSVTLDIGVGVAVAASWLVAKITGVKLWKGPENFQHLNERWPQMDEIIDTANFSARMAKFVKNNPGQVSLVPGVVYKKKESTNKYLAARETLVISSAGLNKKRRENLLAEYREMMAGDFISFSVWERSTHLFLQLGGKFFDFGFWVIPYWFGKHIKTKLYRFRQRRILFPQSRRLEPVIALKEKETQRLGLYLGLLAKDHKQILGNYYDPGCQDTNGRIDDNRARLGHNCTSWVTTAPIGDDGKCLLEILGTERAHEIGTNPGWWVNWILHGAIADRIPAVIYWTPEKLETVLESQVVTGKTISWDFNKS